MTRLEVLQKAAEIEALGYKLFPGFDGRQRIAVIQDEAPETYGESKIIIPDGAVKPPSEGYVVQLSSYRPEVPPPDTLIVGARVAFTYYNRTEVGLSMRDGSILAVCMLHWSDLYWGWMESGDEKDCNT